MPDLFDDYAPPHVAVGYGADVTGRGAMDNQISRLVSHVLKEADRAKGLSRAEVAKRMGDYLGRPVSKDIVNKWCSESAEGNRISLDAFIALIEVTGDHAALGFIPARFGLVVMPEKYAAIIELKLLEERMAHMQQTADLLKAKVKGL